MVLCIKSLFNTRLLFCCLVFLFGSSTSSTAQTFDFHTSEASDVKTGSRLHAPGFQDTIVVSCNDWIFITSNPTTWHNDFSLKSNNAFVKFYVNNSGNVTKYLAPVNYNYQLAFHVLGFTDPSDSIFVYTLDYDTLTINYNNDSVNTPYQDINLKKYSNFYKMMVIVDMIYRDSSGILVPALLSDTTMKNFSIEASILTHRYDKREYGVGPSTTQPIISMLPYPAQNYIDLSWSFSTGTLTPVNYELEWTYVDDYSVDPISGVETPIPFSDLVYNFKFNNTRVWLSDNTYKIPIIYPRGYIVYRVRSVRPDSVLYKHPVYGNWSLSGSDYDNISALSGDYYHISTPYSGDSLNWQFTTSFAEGGKYKNVASFYDGLLKNRQSITRFNTNLGKLLATGNVYDYEGRLSIKSLPAPVDAPSFSYQYNLLLNSATSAPYHAADFDTGTHRYSIISPLASNALASLYYSSHNPDTILRHQRFVADAEGYPFLQTIFESGTQDRVSAQSGAGRALQIGDANYVSNSYVGAAQPILNSLYGPQIGWSNFYTMTVSRDPNQQYSMNINDYHGKTMVSAIIGNGPDPDTHALTTVYTPSPKYLTMDVLAPDPSSQAIDVFSGTRIADVDYFSEAHSSDSLKYYYSLAPYIGCPGQSLRVKGHYYVTVTDQYGDIVLTQDTVLGANGLDTSTAAFSYTSPNGSFLADVGSYHVNKKLTFSPWDIMATVDTFFKVANCFLTEPYFIRESVTNTVFPCPGDVPGEPAYDSDYCVKKKWDMMHQLFPNAAYGKYTISGGVMYPTDNSIYTIICPVDTIHIPMSHPDSSFLHCYQEFATYGGDTSLITSSQGTRGIVNYRCFCTNVNMPDTCVADTVFTSNITITAYNLFDSTESIYMPFLASTPGAPSMTGSYSIKSNWNLGSINGNIYSGGVVVGHISQHPSVLPGTTPDTTFITLPVHVNGNYFYENLHANALTATGDSILFNFSGLQNDVTAHAQVWHYFTHHYTIDSVYVNLSSPDCHARYQDSCMLPDFPDTITVHGVTYSGLRSMPFIDFNNIYSRAIAAGNYSLAEAMLPLHPQYCQLLNCFTDTFKTRLTEIKDWRTAQSANLLYLDSIIAHDPIKDRMLSTGLFPSPADSLSTYKGGSIRLDSFIYMMAYCACSDSIMFQRCVTDMFSHEITNHLLITDDVKKSYFENITNIYIANRQRFVDSILRHGGNTCGPCAAVRMVGGTSLEIFSEPISIDSTFTTFPGDTSNSWLLGIYADSVDYDSIVAMYHEDDSILCAATIDSIIARLSNCLGSTTSPGTVRHALELIHTSGAAPMGNFTQDQIYGALISSGIVLSDLCNPYVLSYWQFGAKASDNGCMRPPYYASMAGFLTSTAASATLHAPGSVFPNYPLDSVGNYVERDIARSLGNIQDVDVWATYSSTDQAYTLHMVAAGGGLDTMKLHLRSPMCGDIFSTLSSGSYSMNAACINSVSGFSVGTGLVNQYSFLATVVNGSSSCNMIGWLDKVRTMGRPNSEMPRCITCTQMRALYNDFKDTLVVYDIKGTDHPLYRTMLANFMNNILLEGYTTDDYETFIQSCALADSVEMPRYAGYATFRFDNNTAMDNFILALNGLDPDYSFNDAYIDSAYVGGVPELTVSVDLGKVPIKRLWEYKDLLVSYASSGLATGYVINQPLTAMHSAGEIGFIHTDPDFPFSPGDSSIIDTGTHITFSDPYQKAVWLGGRFIMRNFYNVVQTGAAPADISRAIYGITAYLYNHHIPGAVFVPEFQSTIDVDYFKPEKQAYLSYVYDFMELPDYDVLNNLRAQTLIASIPSYAPYNAVYSRDTRPGLFTNLYLWNAGMNTRCFDTLQHIIDIVSPTGAIFNSAPSVSIPLSAPAQMDAYLCSDRSYWYRYFTGGDTLYNVYLKFPDHIPPYLRPSYRVVGRVIPMPGDSVNRHFALNVTLPGSTDTLQLYGLTSFQISKSIQLENLMLRRLPTGDNGGADTFDNCERQRLYAAIHQGVVSYNNYIDSIKRKITGELMEYAVNNANEKLLLKYTTNQKFFTLYNYDRAGNLTSTVPPAGVVPIPDSAGLLELVDESRKDNTPSSCPLPTINKINEYTYTSFNAMRKQTTINGGNTRYMYDAVGRLVFSQNDKQAETGRYTYNIYDNQSRIIETGQAQFGCPHFDPYIYVGNTPPPPGVHACSTAYSPVPGTWLISPEPYEITNSETVPYSDIVNFINGINREEVVVTVYDTAAFALNTIAGFSAQENLRKRVSCVKYFSRLFTADAARRLYVHASHYSYDPQGNVSTLTHDYRRMAAMKRRYVRIDYDYDVISGKVNMLSYNRGAPDQYYQKYGYDADNRIVCVHTSNDGYIWKRDAGYTYYDHGPLARVELGDMRVQGLDYAYTIQGWLKAVNNDTLNGSMDMGEDGIPGSIVSQDAVAQTIDYFTGDYHAITGRQVQHTGTPLRNLYNGNIARQTVAMQQFERLNKQYVYDQLNRILTADYATVDPTDGSLTVISDFHNEYSYDPDGNIQSLLRFGNNTGSGALLMDSLTYHYPSIHHDKLQDVMDAAANTYTNDLQQYTTAMPGGRYRYDAVGNLTANYESGQDTIMWNRDNKVVSAHNMTDTSTLEFEYDAMGNRISKKYIKTTPHEIITKEEVYVRDAQGNILATYRGLDKSPITGTTSPYRDYALAAHDIYGSSRLGQKQYYGLEIGYSVDMATTPTGVWDSTRLFSRVPWYSLEYQDVIKTDSTNLYGNEHTDMYYAKHLTGMKQYEVTDHLGNVLATLSDKRTGATFTPLAGGLTPGADARIDTWKPIVVSAHDYYPFGQYMPGRYSADTLSHCVATTFTGMGTVPYTVVIPPPAAGDISLYGSAVVTYMSLPTVLHMVCTTATSGLFTVLPPVSAQGTHVLVDVGAITNNHTFTVRDNTTGIILGVTAHGTSTSAGLVSIALSPVPHSTSLSLSIECTDPTGGDLYCNGIVLPRDTLTAINIHGNVCSADAYQYGYNGQMKDNEWAGLGNSTDFGDRMLDTRIGRFRSLDPLARSYPNYSPFLFAGNCPTTLIDVKGQFQLDPKMAASYPHIHKYLSTQIEKDVMSSSIIRQAYKDINPNATDANISNIFKNNSGPLLYDIYNPGGENNASGFTIYDKETSSIEINTKIFDYVEKVLKSGASKEGKQLALTYLLVEVAHEVGHEIVEYNGTDAKGKDIKNPRKTNHNEAGYLLENAVWSLPLDNSNEKVKARPDVIEGLEPGNPKNKAGIMDNVVKKANSTEEGKKTLPTVPN